MQACPRMPVFSLFQLLTIVSYVRLLAASPISQQPAQPNTLESRQLSNCSDLRHNLTPACWNVLDVTSYLEGWWQANGTYCTSQNISFVSCYQQLVGYEQEQCDKTGPNMCDYPADFVSRGYTPYEAYTLYTIFAIWQWYESIYEAIQSADLSATGRVGKIVTTINPKVPKKVSLGDFLQALTAMTPLITSPASLVEALGKDIGKSFVETALRQTPGVIKQLNPTGTLDSEFVQVNDLYDGLSTMKTTYQQNVSNALGMIQQNFTTFNIFAANGNFIAPRTSLEANTQNLTLALETYIVSQCLTANNIIVTLARDTNPHALAHNGSLTTSSLVSCDSYDQYGVCSAWWYDPGTNAAFGLSSLQNPSKNYYELMQTMFSSGWTTGSALFLGAKNCADYVAVTGGDHGPGLATETMTPRCLSNIQVCVWDKTCGLTDPNCEFTGEYGREKCKPQHEYLQKSCQESGDVTSVDVPAAYLGGLDTTEVPALIVCNRAIQRARGGIYRFIGLTS